MPYSNCCHFTGPMRNKEFKVSQSGNSWIKFTVCHKPWSKDKDKEPDMLFLNCIAFGKSAEWLAEAPENAHVTVSGELRANNYTNKEGVEIKGVTLHCKEAFAFTVDHVKQTSENKNSRKETKKTAEPVEDSDIPF